MKEFPVIIMSAKTSVEDKVSLLLGGAVYYKTLLYKGTAGKNHRRSAHSSRLSNNYSHLFRYSA